MGHGRSLQQTVENRTVRPFLCSLLLLSALTPACRPKRETSSEPEKRYVLSGSIVALDSKHHTASIDAAAIPNYMEAMTMDYPVKSDAEFAALHVGDKITATLNVSASGADYYVSNIRKQKPGTK